MGGMTNSTSTASTSVARKQLLMEAFNIRTIGDLGRNKYFRAAAAIVELANSAK